MRLPFGRRPWLKASAVSMQIVERGTADDAVLPADRVEHLIVGRDRAGVAHRRRLAAFAAPDLDQEDRLAGGERLFRRRHEGLRPADALDQADDDLGVLVVDQEVDVVGEIEIELVAARDRVGEIEAAQRRLLQPELERAAGLEHDADRAGLKPAHALGRIEQELLAERERAHAVRSGNAKPVLVGQGEQRLRALLALGIAAFAELRGVDQRAFQAVRRGLGERVDDGDGRDDGQREIDGLRDRREVRIDRPAPQLAPLRIDQIELRRKAGEFEVVVDFLDPAAAA